MSYAKTSTGLIQHTAFPGAALPAWLTEVEGDLNTGNVLNAEDTSFEGGTVGAWGSLWNCTFVNDATEGYHGTHSAKMTVTANGVAEAKLVVTALTSAGAEYTYAIKLKSATGRQYLLQFQDNVSGRQSGAIVTADGTWQTATITATYGAGSATREITVRAHTGAQAGDIIYWDSAILIAGPGPATPPTTLVADPVSVAAGECTIETDCDRAAAIIHTTDHYTSYLTAGSIIARAKAKLTAQPAGDYAQGLACSDTAAAPAIGGNDLDYDEPSSQIVNAAASRRAEYRAALIYNVVAGALDTYDIHEIKFDATDAHVRCLDPATMEPHAGCEGSNAHAYANELWFYAGERRNDNYYGTMLLAYFQLYLSHTVTIGPLQPGETVKLYDSTGTEKASAVESGGQATLDVEPCEFPFTGFFKRFQGATEIQRLPRTGEFTDLWGGDAWPVPIANTLIPDHGRVQTRVTIVGANFGATQGSSVVEFENADVIDYISWTDDEIKVLVPTGAATGEVTVEQVV